MFTACVIHISQVTAVIMAVFVLNAMRMATAAKAEETEEVLRREIGMIESHLILYSFHCMVIL